MEDGHLKDQGKKENHFLGPVGTLAEAEMELRLVNWE